jgi:hypothetical protein
MTGTADLFDQQNEEHQEREAEDEVYQVFEIREGKVHAKHPNELRYAHNRHLGCLIPGT